MRAYCSHCHSGFQENPGDIRQLFWRTVALVARLWLAVAMEMLRRSDKGWSHGDGPEGRALPPIASNEH